MSQADNKGFQQNAQENVIEIFELIKLTLDLTGLIQRRFKVYRYDQQAQVVGNIRGLLAEIFDMDLFPDDRYARFLAGAFEAGYEDEI